MRYLRISNLKFNYYIVVHFVGTFCKHKIAFDYFCTGKRIKLKLVGKYFRLRCPANPKN